MRRRMSAVSRKGSKKRALRIYFATDIHGSEVCFRKFLAAAKVYQADVMHPGRRLRRQGHRPGAAEDGIAARPRSSGEDVTVPEAEWDRLAADIDQARPLPVRMDARRAGRAVAGTRQRWTGCSAARSRRSCSGGATSPPSGSTPQCAASSRRATMTRWTRTRCWPRTSRVECPELELCDLGPVTMASLGVVPTHAVEHRAGVHRGGPGQADQRACSTRCPSGRPCILNLHCPPYASGLDDAPELDATLKPVIRGGRPSIVPVGSHAVRDAIKRYQPVVGCTGTSTSRGACRRSAGPCASIRAVTTPPACCAAP